MAVSLESAGKVRRKAKEFVKSPGIFLALKALFADQATTGKNVDLQFLPFGTDSSGANGEVLLTGAATVYAVYGRKQNTATDSFLWFLDDATDDSALGTDGRVMLAFPVAEQEAFAWYPRGIAMATGILSKTYTDADGTTDSTSTDVPVGFLIIGA